MASRDPGPGDPMDPPNGLLILIIIATILGAIAFGMTGYSVSHSPTPGERPRPTVTHHSTPHATCGRAHNEPCLNR